MNDVKTSLRRVDNKITFKGYLRSKDLIEGTFDNGMPYIRGNIIIGKDADNSYKVEVFASQKTKANKDNKLYESLNNIKNLPSVSETLMNGGTPAKISIIASFDSNIYYNSNYDKIIDGVRYKGVAVHQTDYITDEQMGADFQIEAYIEYIGKQIIVKKTENETEETFTGNYIINAFLPLYANEGARVMPMKLVVPKESTCFNTVVNFYESGTTGLFYGRLVWKTNKKIEQPSIDVVGDVPKNEVEYKPYLVYEVTAAGKETYHPDSEKALNKETIKIAMKEREVEIEQLLLSGREEKNKNQATKFSY